jgi:hypothetical protein
MFLSEPSRSPLPLQTHGSQAESFQVCICRYPLFSQKRWRPEKPFEILRLFRVPYIYLPGLVSRLLHGPLEKEVQSLVIFVSTNSGDPGNWTQLSLDIPLLARFKSAILVPSGGLNGPCQLWTDHKARPRCTPCTRVTPSWSSSFISASAGDIAGTHLEQSMRPYIHSMYSYTPLTHLLILVHTCF